MSDLPNKILLNSVWYYHVIQNYIVYQVRCCGTQCQMPSSNLKKKINIHFSLWSKARETWSVTLIKASSMPRFLLKPNWSGDIMHVDWLYWSLWYSFVLPMLLRSRGVSYAMSFIKQFGFLPSRWIRLDRPILSYTVIKNTYPHIHFMLLFEW